MLRIIDRKVAFWWRASSKLDIIRVGRRCAVDVVAFHVHVHTKCTGMVLRRLRWNVIQTFDSFR